jgi:hypothetical protein
MLFARHKNSSVMQVCICLHVFMSAGLCLEMLLATVIAWVGVWGLVDEAVQLVQSRNQRCFIYAMLVIGAVALATAQRSLTVCALL